MLALVLTVVLVLSGTLPAVLRPVLRRRGVIDVPNARSSHARPAVRGMGLATWIAIVVGMLLALLTGAVRVDRAVTVIVLLLACAAAVLGWAEDFRGVSVRARAGTQLLVGVVGTTALALALGQSGWWIPAGTLAIAVYINVANFMDGINGISGLHGLTVGLFYALAGQLSGQTWLTVSALVLAAAFAAFLPWNLAGGRARGPVFLGDVGSYLLGGMIAAMAAAGFLAGVYVEYLLSPLVIYLADTAFTWVRRVRAGARWYAPHRQHVYQRLTDAGLSHLGSAAVVTACTVAVGLLGFIAAQGTLATSAAAAVAGIAVVAGYLVSPTVITRRRGRAPRPRDVPDGSRS
ncbi:UDP-phosphate glycosyltransferase [Tersicoccus phoenicis]|uniref:UDP-phosphate glycosyltransferase n=1 Tax=Tersicoccus phoenicis TaxID=554083 RepID=A0A1R1L9A8_9MICC|nr:UDP-phosphate glycosyltransferase [Tersicoccus phoenicis]OMH24089.1 UDP-phosphate glycosyltransferase [Tersicoccus phoenicis]